MTALKPDQVAERLEALLALRHKAELGTTQPFQPDERSWSIVERFDGDEDLVANNMSFNVANFFSEASNALSLYHRAASLIRTLEADRRSLAERIEKLEGARRDLRMKRAGMAQVLAEVAVECSEDSREMIQSALDDWAADTGWEVVRTLNRFDLYPPMSDEGNAALERP